MALRRETLCTLLDLYGNALSGRCREVLEFYYADDLSLAEISENLGITRQGVHDAIRRGEAELASLEKALGFCEKASRAVALAGEIAEKTDDPGVKALAEELEALFTAESEGEH